MERLHQMSIIPDILPDFHPTLDLRLNAPHKRVARAKPVWKPVEPGVFLNTNMVNFWPHSASSFLNDVSSPVDMEAAALVHHRVPH
jgi:hypothetical protein